MPDRTLGSIGAKVVLASRLGLIDTGVEQPSMPCAKPLHTQLNLPPSQSQSTARG